MDIDFPEYLYDLIKPENIDFGDYDTSGFGMVLPRGLIFLNRNDCLEQQIKSALHETLHFHPRFMSYAGALFSGAARNDKIKSEIEQIAIIVYKTCPKIVEKFRQGIKEAKQHYLNR